jgi:phage-related protein
MKIFYLHKRIDDFINHLDGISLKSLMRSFNLLQVKGHELRMPHSKSVGNGLFELRVPSNPPIRVIFGFYEDKALITHIFFKRTMRIQRRELEYAIMVWKNSLA